jgi:hypothetical protein
MPRKRQPGTPKEERERRLARAARKREAKARERRAKSDGAHLYAEETTRAASVARAGIPPAEWDAFLTALARAYEARKARSLTTADGLAPAAADGDKARGERSARRRARRSS